MRWPGRIAFALGVVVAFLLTLWAGAALFFDWTFPRGRVVLAIVYLVVIVVGIWRMRRTRLALLVPFAGFMLVVLWWLTLKPTNEANWQPDNAQTAYIDENGDQITIHNFRNCDYRTETDYTCNWETRSFDLAKLAGADIFITWWGSPWIAHPIVSFDFGDQGHVAMSIETRDTVGQEYSAVRGFFRQYALTYIAADEADVVRLRTNYRKDEEVYLFRTKVSPQLARGIFLEYVRRADSLHKHPEWYNAVTNNCTTNIAVSASEAQKISTRLDWRILLNGKMDEMMYEHGRLVTGGLSLPALKEQAHINPAAKNSTREDFSNVIRKGRVGFTEQATVAKPSS